jgi:Acyclic terpene utilisation family protein AtuA
MRRANSSKQRMLHSTFSWEITSPVHVSPAAALMLEVTMGLLAKRMKAGQSGYIDEFLTYVLEPLLATLLAKKTRVITNAGGLDPRGLKFQIEKYLQKKGLGQVKVAAIWGDDLLPQLSSLSNSIKPFDPLNGSTPESNFSSLDKLLSINAYLGSGGIIHALHSGAQIIVTGRVVDSALVLGPLAYAGNWSLPPSSTHLDLLAAGSLAGHIIECGAQCTGGNFTDWREGAFSSHGGWSNMGYPILEFFSSGEFVITKPSRTGGVVSPLSVTEQMLYEVLDPANYLLPDVNLDLTDVRVTSVGRDRVLVRGAKGRMPTPWVKCTAIRQEGYRVEGALIIPGFEARMKAKILGDALVQRANMILKKMKTEPITEYRIETPGAEEMLGYYVLLHGTKDSDFSEMHNSREVILRIAAAHNQKRALDVLAMEMAYVLH